jgi:hypothetical protein
MEIKLVKKIFYVCVLASTIFFNVACSILFPAAVPPPGEVYTDIDHVPFWEQYYFEHAIIYQQPPTPPVNGAPV